jgi:hypothetical protein
MYASRVTVPGIQAPLSGAEAALIGLAALGVVMIPFLWPLADHLDTMAHEGAHAIAASAMGFTLLGVTLDQDAGGVTSYLGPAAGPGTVLTAFVGYPGPSVFGLCGAKLIETGHAASVPWVAAVLLVLLLSLVRRSFGIVSVLASIALLAAVLRYSHDALEAVVVYALTWLLLLSGARTAVAHGASAGNARRDHSPSLPTVGAAVDRGVAPGRRHRRQVAGLAILSNPDGGRKTSEHVDDWPDEEFIDVAVLGIQPGTEGLVTVRRGQCQPA